MAAADAYEDHDEAAAPSPVIRTTRTSRPGSGVSQRPSSPRSFKEKERLRASAAFEASRRGAQGRPLALSISPSNFENVDEGADERLHAEQDHKTTAAPIATADGAEQQPRGRRSLCATEIYTVSYLIFFSILGTLARLGLQWLTFYPGTPSIFPVLWANFAGTLLIGYFTEDQRLFRGGWGGSSVDDRESLPHRLPQNTKALHVKVKKTIPLYIGLTTGFCGSLTSFSTFMRDAFLALSNDLPSPINHDFVGPAPSTSSTVSRNGGYSFMALVAVITLTLSVCYCALQLGAHLSMYTDGITPTIRFGILRRILDPLFVFLGVATWLGAVLMTIWPPDRPGGPGSPAGGSWEAETWRGQALLACVFAPLGCLLRFYLSLKLNSIAPSFPLGTFVANIFGTAVLGMAYDLQHVQLATRGLGGGRIGRQVLQGIIDGFCGSLTTVSTWVLELDALRRGPAYLYGGVSVAAGLGVLVVVMGSVRWSVGWGE